MIKILGDSVDLTGFDFTNGVFTSSIIKPRANKPKPNKDPKTDFMKGIKANNPNALLPPIRQTASIFKQPVTVVKVSEDSKVKSDTAGKTTKAKDKPRYCDFLKLEVLFSTSVVIWS